MAYLDDARSRAKRRKSPWNLLLIPAVLLPWGALCWVTWAAFAQAYRAMHPEQQFTGLPDGIAGIIMAVAPFFAWIGPSMILGNLFVAAIPQARRVLDAEASGFPGTDRRSANRGLLRMSVVMTPPCLLIGLL
jgi:hypothetical protein